jgi:hypothetical protein
MTPRYDTENARALRLASQRDPVTAAVAALYCLTDEQVVTLAVRLQGMASRAATKPAFTLTANAKEKAQ